MAYVNQKIGDIENYCPVAAQTKLGKKLDDLYAGLKSTPIVDYTGELFSDEEVSLLNKMCMTSDKTQLGNVFQEILDASKNHKTVEKISDEVAYQINTSMCALFAEAEIGTKLQEMADIINGQHSGVSFKIGEIEYEAESNMTWEDWLYSEYNTDEFVDGEGSIVKEIEGNFWVVVDGDTWEDYVPTSETIINNKEYGFLPIPVTFEIEDKGYDMNPDSTWEDWINSSYNTDGYKIPSGLANVVNADETKFVGIESQGVKPSEKITQGESYILINLN